MVGVPFLAAPIVAAYPNARLIVEVAWGANLTAGSGTWTWTDETANVRQADGQKITITPGRGNESSQAQPADCTFQLDNTTGNYTPNNPVSIRYPNVRRNTPIRVSVDLGAGGGVITRFYGSANGFTPSWDKSAKLAVITVSASGSLRRLQQGRSPLDSPMRTSILAAKPKAYWPFEDKSGSTQVASGITSGTPLTFSGTLKYASESTLAGSATAATLTATTPLWADIKDTFSGQWQVDWYTKMPALSSNTIVMRVFASGTVAYWDFVIGPNFQAVYGFNSAGTRIVDSGAFTLFSWMIGQWMHLRLMTKQTGANVDWRFIEFPLVGTGGAFTGTLANATVGDATAVNVPSSSLLDGTSIAHLAVFDAYDFSATDQSAMGYSGEAPFNRLQRLCDEQRVSFTWLGGAFVNGAMGPQSVDTFVNLLRECETADSGVLYDGFTDGLFWHDNRNRYNQSAALTLDMAAGQVDDPFAPVDDDQRNRNLAIVSRKNGSSAVYQDVTGPLGTNAIGTYDTSLTVNYADDTKNLDRASWEVHKGTVEGLRYPNLNLDFVANPSLLPAWLATKLNNRIDVTNVTSKAIQHPPGTLSLLLEGYTETLSPYEWKVSPANCSPYDPYRVFKFEDTALGRLDTSGSTLLSGVSAAATSLSVQTTSGPLWITTAAFPTQFPFDVNVGGWKATTTAIANATPTFVGVGAAAAGNATSVTPALPAGIQAGDLLLCFAGERNDTVGWVPAMAGWTVLQDMHGGTARLFGKIATGSDTAPTVTFNSLVAGDTTLAQCAAFRSVTIRTVAGTGDVLNASAQNIAYPGLSVPANCLVLYLGWKQANWTSVATIAGATEIGEPSSALGGSMGLVWDYQIQNTATTIASGSFVVTGGVAAISRGAVVALDTSAIQTFTVNAVPGAIPANAVVKLWNPGVLGL